ncbi:MAG TPA: nitroreductase family deazaflavin-dependent oxidoreductase [Rubrobacter sp.]|jgi:deazaflavin-dependent oxidoreductase (nitroreductase family)|nr:nitroreductase family deazaflavin-dependent oxidoreductase [Rubrobacter sp.]
MTESERETSTERDLSGPARLALKLGSGAHAGVYRATGGKLFGRMGKSPILLLNTVGRKTGRKRTTPLLYVMDGEDFVIIASKGGAATHPAWYLNLRANPDATVEIGDREVQVEAGVADPEEKARLWQKMVEMYPTYDDYQRKTEREIPLLVLRPVERGGAS